MTKFCMTSAIIASFCLAIITPPMSYGSLVPADDIVLSDEKTTSRSEDLKTVRKVLEQKLVQQRLYDLGLGQEDINSRLDGLSDTQLHLMASQLNAVLPAGDSGTVWTIVGILLIVVLVILLATLL